MVDYYLSGTGLAIDPQYRGRGNFEEITKMFLSNQTEFLSMNNEFDDFYQNHIVFFRFSH